MGFLEGVTPRLLWSWPDLENNGEMRVDTKGGMLGSGGSSKPFRDSENQVGGEDVGEWVWGRRLTPQPLASEPPPNV